MSLVLLDVCPTPVMSQLRNIALTVQELEIGEFYWVLMEAADQVMDDALPYHVIDTAVEPQLTYSNALVAGVAALRRMYGKDGPRF